MEVRSDLAEKGDGHVGFQMVFQYTCIFWKKFSDGIYIIFYII